MKIDPVKLYDARDSEVPILLAVRDRLMRAGLLKGGKALNEAINTLGWEIAERLEPQQ